MVPASILVADDQPHIVEALRLLLKPEGYRIDTAHSPSCVLTAMDRQAYDVVVMDLNYARDTTSGREGLDLIGRIRDRDALTPVVVMTAWSNVALAVEAMRRGACDFVQKPWDNARLLSIVRTQTELGRAVRHAAAVDLQQRQDLELAAQVQRELLPRHPPAIATLDCAASCTPAGVVGGDYFDFIRIDQTRMAIALGDVAGKGVAAALLMTSLQAMLRSRAAECGGDVPRLITDTNARLCAMIPENKYATLFYGAYCDRERTLTYVNAGHNPALLIRAAGAVERLSTGGAVLGMFPDGAFSAATVGLERGDRLVIYSDGVTEALNEAGDEFGEDRLLAAASGPAPDATAIHGAALREHAAFCGDAPRRDDMTLLVTLSR
jgi:phosphoserine phosphatase RsbU/P